MEAFGTGWTHTADRFKGIVPPKMKIHSPLCLTPQNIPGPSEINSAAAKSDTTKANCEFIQT